MCTPDVTMNRKRIFAQLKNGKNIDLSYRQSDEVICTIRIAAVETQFQLHTYHFDGNEVTDEASYKDEKIRLFHSTDELLDTLVQEFPGIETQPWP